MWKGWEVLVNKSWLIPEAGPLPTPPPRASYPPWLDSAGLLCLSPLLPKSKIKACICKANSWRVTAGFDENPLQTSWEILPSSLFHWLALFHPRITAHSPDGWWAASWIYKIIQRHWASTDYYCASRRSCFKWAAGDGGSLPPHFPSDFTTRILIRLFFTCR